VKSINKGIIAAVVGATAFVASAAHASDGTITINGKISDQTCTINGGAGGNITVTLPTVQRESMPTAGSTAGRTGFAIALTNCLDNSVNPAVPSTSKVYAFFEQGPTINPSNGHLLNMATATPATNVEVQFLNDDGTPIDMSKSVADLPGGQGAKPVTITGGSANLRYAAQYFATAALPGSGLVQSTVVYSLHYQ
jgi:major type 1 subunit fimbrin (pilin)